MGEWSVQRVRAASIATILVIALTGTVTAASAGPAVAVRAQTLPVKVRSVTATLTPYNPQFSSAGIPAEQVTFTVGRPSTPSYVCTIEVWRSGKLIGSTSMIGGTRGERSSRLHVSVPVSIRGSTFAGKPSDAHVTCHVSTSGTLRAPTPGG